MRGIKGILFLFIFGLLFLSFINNSPNNRANAYSDYLYSESAIKVRIVKKAINYGLDPALALSVAKQESNFDRAAKSSVGAIGLFQLMPSTADNLGVQPYYVNENIEGGISYLKSLKNQFKYDKLVLAAYNAGPGAVQRYGGIPPYHETRHYVSNIMSYYKQYKNNPDPVIVAVKNNIHNTIANNIKNTIENNETPKIAETTVQSGPFDFIKKIFGFLT